MTLLLLLANYQFSNVCLKQLVKEIPLVLPSSFHAAKAPSLSMNMWSIISVLGTLQHEQLEFPMKPNLLMISFVGSLLWSSLIMEKDILKESLLCQNFLAEKVTFFVCSNSCHTDLQEQNLLLVIIQIGWAFLVSIGACSDAISLAMLSGRSPLRLYMSQDSSSIKSRTFSLPLPWSWINFPMRMYGIKIYY